MTHSDTQPQTPAADHKHLISVDQLLALIDDPQLRLLDVRWTLQTPDGKPDYLDGHIPSAVYVSLDDQLTAHQRPNPELGRHPLPSAEQFQETLRDLGIDENSRVVLYDDASSMAAARGWWLMRWAGLAHVQVLDGGLAAWKQAGGDLGHGEDAPTHPRTDYTVTPSLPTTDAAGAARLARTGVLVDARAPERYRGETEPMDAKAGHIPGAVNRPAGLNTPGGTWASTQELRAAWQDLGVLDADGNPTSEVGVYCGSGVTACHNALSLALVGVTPVLYGPSWSGWSSNPDNPVATGPDAG